LAGLLLLSFTLLLRSRYGPYISGPALAFIRNPAEILSEAAKVFVTDFTRWLDALTWTAFLLVFWPFIAIDLTRSLGKSAILLLDAAHKRIKPQARDPSFLPKVSVIIPAHNEEKTILASINSAMEADYPDKEVVVVDDGSKDKTYVLAKSYANRGSVKLLHRDVASGSKAGAMNHGLLFASGDVVVTVDADTLLEKSSLKQIVRMLDDPNVSAVSGNVRILRGEKGGNNLTVKLQAYEYVLSLELGRRFNSVIGSLLMISGAFGAFWKKDVRALGEYDMDTITEDFDITLKVRKLGKRLVFADKAVSWTFAPENWRDWRRQRIRWARGQAETLWKHRNIFRREGFDFMYVLAIYDMLLVDVMVPFMRFAWIFWLLFFYSSALLYVLLLMVLLYFATESVAFLTAGLLSPRKTDLRKAYLIPVMVLFYRPYYSLIRMKAYFDWILMKEIKW
jgi:cellulose synthase/poly-beta-1,6-N-acetylglucosamine synthase-like glycosyltransferase